MAVLPGVLECRTLRRTVQVRLGTITLRLPGSTPILFALAALRSVPQAGSQFRGLATVIHEIFGLSPDIPWPPPSLHPEVNLSDQRSEHLEKVASRGV